MGKKILVAYASKAGSTAEVAEAIGKEFGLAGAQVDVMPVEDVKTITDYQAVVVGGAIRAGSWLGAAINFVKQNQEALKTKPTAFFQVGMTLAKDTPENQAIVSKFLAPVRKIVPPVAEGKFAGKMDYSKLGFIARFVVKKMAKVPEGDFRDWNKIKQWARETYPKLVKN